MSMGINNAALNQLAMSEKAQPLLDAVIAHIRDNVDPITEEYYKLGEGRADRWSHAPGQLELLQTAKDKARANGLWNFFLPNAKQAKACPIWNMRIWLKHGQNPLASEVFNCSAPDTGNMEVLERIGTQQQKDNGSSPCSQVKSALPMR